MSRLRPLLRQATTTLEQAGVVSAEHDARALAVHALGLHRSSDLAMVEHVDPNQQAAFADLLARRASRVPLQHLTGTVGFRYLDLEVGAGVFVPRPETESLVQWVVDSVARFGWRAPLCVDLCAGSGTIALALANEVSGATVHAVELDPHSFAFTRRNAARRLAAGDPEVHLHLGCCQDALTELDGQCDLVVSNPPYLATDEAQVCDQEVLDHDPAAALWAGPGGLDVIRMVEQAGRRLLRPGGLLVVEHSDRHGVSAPALFGQSGGWTDVVDHQDLTGRDRFVTARREGGSLEHDFRCP